MVARMLLGGLIGNMKDLDLLREPIYPKGVYRLISRTGAGGN